MTGRYVCRQKIGKLTALLKKGFEWSKTRYVRKKDKGYRYLSTDSPYFVHLLF